MQSRLLCSGLIKKQTASYLNFHKCYEYGFVNILMPVFESIQRPPKTLVFLCDNGSSDQNTFETQN